MNEAEFLLQSEQRRFGKLPDVDDAEKLIVAFERSALDVADAGLNDHDDAIIRHYGAGRFLLLARLRRADLLLARLRRAERRAI